MAKSRSSRRGSSRKMKHTRKHKSHRRRTHRKRSTRRRGGMAPVNYHLSGSWPSRMSLGQGADYFKYHTGQHGGVAPLSAIGSTLPPALRGPAHIGGIDQAYADIAGLKDGPTDPIVRPSTGGRRRRHKKSRKHSRKAHRKSYRNKRRSGGALGYAPFPSQGMLLKSSEQYAQAGLNPEWKTDVAFTDAKIRMEQ
jgi:hypothetical protein